MGPPLFLQSFLHSCPITVVTATRGLCSIPPFPASAPLSTSHTRLLLQRQELCLHCSALSVPALLRDCLSHTCHPGFTQPWANDSSAAGHWAPPGGGSGPNGSPVWPKLGKPLLPVCTGSFSSCL